MHRVHVAQKAAEGGGEETAKAASATSTATATATGTKAEVTSVQDLLDATSSHPHPSTAASVNAPSQFDYPTRSQLRKTLADNRGPFTVELDKARDELTQTSQTNLEGFSQSQSTLTPGGLRQETLTQNGTNGPMVHVAERGNALRAMGGGEGGNTFGLGAANPPKKAYIFVCTDDEYVAPDHFVRTVRRQGENPWFNADENDADVTRVPLDKIPRFCKAAVELATQSVASAGSPARDAFIEHSLRRGPDVSLMLSAFHFASYSCVKFAMTSIHNKLVKGVKEVVAHFSENVYEYNVDEHDHVTSWLDYALEGTTKTPCVSPDHKKVLETLK